MYQLEQPLERFHRMPDEEKQRRLGRSGIPADFNSIGITNFAVGYAVQIHNLSVLDIRKRMLDGGPSAHGYQSMPADIRSPLIHRLERLAIRALYTLGLDSGEVMLSLLGEQDCLVRAVTSEPWRKHEALQRLYHDRVVAQQDLDQDESLAEQSPGKPLIGMDPEFLLVRMPERRVVPASRYLGRLGIAGCDAVTRRGRTLYPVAELRPAPSSEPARLLAHLRQAFAAASKRITDRSLIWQAGGMPQQGLPLGGHLHFSGVELSGSFLRALDNYLALPVALLEDPGAAHRRPHYGALGDFRIQPYGGFEYRTLPSFLVSPQLAKGVIGLAYLIATHYRQLRLRPLDEDDVHQAFYYSERSVLLRCLTPLIQDIVSLDAYPMYAGYVAPLLDSLRQGKRWDESRDIRPLWKLPCGP